MGRAGRIVVPGVPHHVTQRGNNRQDVFFVDADRRVYLDLLRRHGERCGLRVSGYCLMTNHLHLVAIPEREDSLARALGRAHLAYTQYINGLHGRVGHLWQNRFYSCPLDDAHALQALAYVDLNPVRAGMAGEAWAYPWSSGAWHCGRARAEAWLDEADWRERAAGMDWAAVLRAAAGDQALHARLRAHTHAGRPLGSDSFLSKLEALLGRRVRPRPEGRPVGWRKVARETNEE